MAWIDAATEVVTRGQAHRVHCETGHLVPPGRKRRGKVVLLDMQTANVMLTVYRALSTENQNKFEAMDVRRATTIAWKVVR